MHDILAGLNDRQREAATTTEGPLLVIAGAGSGKTKTLTHRIAYMIDEKKVSPWSIMAVTFTNKAAEEMKNRTLHILGKKPSKTFGPQPLELKTDLPVVGTFHSICARILRTHAHLLGYENTFTIYDATDQQMLMKQLMSERNIDPQHVNPRAILAAISGAKNQLITPHEYFRYVNSEYTEKVAELYKPYQEGLKKNSALDFDDLLMKTVEVLRSYNDVLAGYQDRFQYLSVDEYQDTNHAQFVLTRLLAEKHKNICAIGDEDQSIYSWRGATIKNILDFEKNYPEAKVVKLEQNYRSTQNVLDAAHCVIEKNSQRKEKKLWTESDSGEQIRTWRAQNERRESELVALEIKELMQKQETPDYLDFCVLYRTNAQSRVMEEIFLRYGIPYKIIGGIKFYDRKEIKDMLAYLRVIINPRDSVSLLRILNVPPRKIGPKTISVLQHFAGQQGIGIFEAMEKIDQLDGIMPDAKITALKNFAKMIRVFQELDRQNSAAGMIKYVLKETDYKNFLDDGSSEGEERIENVRELISVAKKYDALEPGMSLRIFLEEVSLISDVDSMNEKENSVTMMTIHSAKGLEFTNVFIIGAEEGVFPHSRSLLDPNQLEEERRLMYVAVTRAKERLYILYTRERLLYGEYKQNAPSQFIEDIDERLVERNFITDEQRGGGYFDATYNEERDSGRSSKRRKFLEKERKHSKPVPLEDVDNPFHDGDKVDHDIFGRGVVLNVAGGVVTVVFQDNKVGVKKFAVSIAPLKRV